MSTALQTCLAHRCNPDLPYLFALVGESPHLHGLIFKWDQKLSGPLLILEWVFLTYEIIKTITTGPEMMSQRIMKA